MRRTSFFAVWVLALCTLWVRDASAQGGGWGWLEKLSGPGPFDGFEVGLSRCVGKHEQNGSIPIASELLFCKGLAKDKKPIAWGTLEGGYFWGKNDLALAEGSASKTIHILSLEARLDYDLVALFEPKDDKQEIRSLEVGLGVGVMHVSGKTVDDFWRFQIIPVRFGIRPFALAGWGRPWSNVQVYFKAVYQPQELLGQKFGAAPDVFRVSGEFQLAGGIGIVLDRKKE